MKLHLPVVVVLVLALVSVGFAAGSYFIRMPDPAGSSALAKTIRTTDRIGFVDPPEAAWPVASAASAAALIDPAPAPASDLRLIGIVASSQATESVVLLSVANKAAEAARTGDTVAGWRVGRIQADEVELERGGLAIRVRLAALLAGETGLAKASAPALQQPLYDPGPIVSGKPGLE